MTDDELAKKFKEFMGVNPNIAKQFTDTIWSVKPELNQEQITLGSPQVVNPAPDIEMPDYEHPLVKPMADQSAALEDQNNLLKQLTQATLEQNEELRKRSAQDAKDAKRSRRLAWAAIVLTGLVGAAQIAIALIKP